MLDVAILGQVALGYSPFIDRNRSVTATRLSVFPLRPDATLDVAQLLHAVGDVWPASGGKVSLNVVSESLLHDLLQASPSANLMVEVPNFMAADPANVEALTRLHAEGSTLLLKGRPNARAAAPGAAVLQVLDHRHRRRAPHRRGRDRAGRRDAGDRARAVGRAHGRRHGGELRARCPRRARLADRRRAQRHRASRPASRSRNPTSR